MTQNTQWSGNNQSNVPSSPPGSKIEVKPPKIMFTPETIMQIQAFIDECRVECSGLGKVQVVPEGLLVTEIVFLNQRNGPGSTELDQGALATWMFEREESHGDVKDFRLWWHSHVDMGVFWSGVDLTCINETFGQGDWMIHYVGNKRREYRLRFDLYKPCRLTFDNLAYELSFDKEAQATFRDQVRQELQEKSKSESYGYQSGSSGSGYSGGQYGGGYRPGDTWRNGRWERPESGTPAAGDHRGYTGPSSGRPSLPSGENGSIFASEGYSVERHPSSQAGKGRGQVEDTTADWANFDWGAVGAEASADEQAGAKALAAGESSGEAAERPLTIEEAFGGTPDAAPEEDSGHVVYVYVKTEHFNEADLDVLAQALKSQGMDFIYTNTQERYICGRVAEEKIATLQGHSMVDHVTSRSMVVPPTQTGSDLPALTPDNSVMLRIDVAQNSRTEEDIQVIMGLVAAMGSEVHAYDAKEGWFVATVLEEKVPAVNRLIRVQSTQVLDTTPAETNTASASAEGAPAETQGEESDTPALVVN